MDARSNTNPDKSPLDFGKADLAGGALVCAECKVPIGEEYYALGDAVYCTRCQASAQAALAQGAGLVGCVRSGLFGFVAAACGALVWGGVTHFTGYELGIIAIAVGFAVGVAVKVGSGGRGGLPYQLLAVAFTYLGIVSTYVPHVLDAWSAMPSQELLDELAAAEAAAGGEGELDESEFADEGALAEEGDLADAPPASLDDGTLLADDEAADAWPVDESGQLEVTGGVVIAAFVMALALPFLMGFENAIGILIIGIALFEAWRQTRRTQLALSGPFRVGDRSASRA